MSNFNSRASSPKKCSTRVTFPKQSVELTAGIIGVGIDEFQVDPKGGLVRAGYKFNLLQPDGTALSGLYVKPEYAWSFFDYDSNDRSKRMRSSMQTVMFCIGCQQKIKRLVLDGFVGAGVGWGNLVEFQYTTGL